MPPIRGVHFSHILCPYFTQTTNPSIHQESITARIRLYSLRIVNFPTHSVMFYDSVTKQVRNSYEYSRDLAGFGLSRQDTVPNSLRCAIAYFKNTAIRLRIDNELVKNTPNAVRIWNELTEIRDNSRDFLSR